MDPDDDDAAGSCGPVPMCLAGVGRILSRVEDDEALS